jgi:hypothetical protein
VRVSYEQQAPVLGFAQAKSAAYAPAKLTRGPPDLSRFVNGNLADYHVPVNAGTSALSM